MKLNNSFKNLSPSLVYKIWGSERMATLKGVKGSSTKGEPLGESWEVSIHPDGPSLLEGRSLKEIVSEEELPYLVKLIDTEDNLSVQVHPDDDFAKAHENSQGKTECWIILGAQDGCGIYLGLKPGITKEEFKVSLSNGSSVNDLLVFHEVKKGDFFFVPAGTIHAIGKGVFLAEVQQSSGITYRVWDWNRVNSSGESRELHIDKAMKVSRFESDFNNEKNFKIKKNIFEQNVSLLINHPSFNVRQVPYKKGEKLQVELLSKGRVPSVLNLEGVVKTGGAELKEFQSAIGSLNEGLLLEVEGVSDGNLLLVE